LDPQAAGLDVPPPHAWKLYLAVLAATQCHARHMSERLELMGQLGVKPQVPLFHPAPSFALSVGCSVCLVLTMWQDGAETSACRAVPVRGALHARRLVFFPQSLAGVLVHSLQPACYVVALRQMSLQRIGPPAFTTIMNMKVRPSLIS
jgi:hypothetical protein